MKLTKWFWIPFFFLLIAFSLPTFFSFNAPDYDGERVYGFPFPFYSKGGLCPGNIICTSFSLMYLVVNLLILIAIPVLSQYFSTKFIKKKT